jgi:hypothetical protein
MKAIRTTLVIASLAILPFAGTASAQDALACDDDGMMKVEMMMKEFKGDKMKADEAMKASEAAAMAKKDGKMEDCAKNLNMAAESLMAK